MRLCLFLAHSLVQRFAGYFRCGLGGVHDRPLHLPSTDFVLGDPAGFARTGFNYRRRSTLELAGAAGGDQDITVVAVEAFNQLHRILPQTYVWVLFRTAGVA